MAAHDEDREFLFEAVLTNHSNDNSTKQDALRAVEPAFDARHFASRIDVTYQEIVDGKLGAAVNKPFAGIPLPEPRELARYTEPVVKATPPIRRRPGSTESAP